MCASILASLGIPLLMNLLGGGSVKVHKHHLGKGTTIHITKTMKNQMTKAHEKNKPFMMKLSKASAKRNIRGSGVLANLYKNLKEQAKQGLKHAIPVARKIAHHVGHKVLAHVKTKASALLKRVDDNAEKIGNHIGRKIGVGMKQNHEMLGSGFFSDLLNTGKSALGSIAQAVVPTVAGLASTAINNKINSKFGGTGGTGIKKPRKRLLGKMKRKTMRGGKVKPKRKVKGQGFLTEILKQVGVPIVQNLVGKALGGSVKPQRLGRDGEGLYANPSGAGLYI